MTETTEQRCCHCHGKGEVDATTNAGEWVKEDCPVCVRPHTAEALSQRKQEVLDVLAALRSAR